MGRARRWLAPCALLLCCGRIAPAACFGRVVTNQAHFSVVSAANSRSGPRGRRGGHLPLATNGGHLAAASAMSSSSSAAAASAAAAFPVATATFWIGFYGLLQMTLWIKIMTIRAVQPTATHELQNLAVSQDIRNLRATRAHGNYTENAPIFSLLLLVVDAMNVVPKLYVNVLGSLFFFGRVFHMMGMWAHEGSTVGRMGGAMSTMASLTIGSCMSIYSAIQAMGGVSMSGVQAKLATVAIIVVIGNCFAGIRVDRKKEQ